MSATYFNTTGLIGEELRDAVESACTQNDTVLAIYRNSFGPLSPSDVWAQCRHAGRDWPLTSVRRAISTLTGDGLLVKLDAQKPGVYAKPEHFWHYSGFQQDLFGSPRTVT